jgi:hypothetical protein
VRRDMGMEQEEIGRENKRPHNRPLARVCPAWS